ncbi:MAG: RNA polymerase sigma factor [Candidatus Aminicenantales bacterium]
MRKKTAEEKVDIPLLLEKVKQGNREAFMTLTALYQKKVFLLAFSFFRNKEDALDIVQETFLRLYQKMDMFQTGKNFQNWLLQITKNICIDYYRKNYGKKSLYEGNRDLEGLPLMNNDNAFNSSDLKSIFSRCLQKLTSKQRMIFVMKHYNQLKYREIAQILNISLGTVKSLHFKAVQNLKNLISPYLGR